ncbi:hypothetical protein PV11_05414 [Exophiala sideris]|uniref:Uncharacterized protein n=1 Tax=Exophiala sideris TaxID=1016849 RepID=A0A0D1Z9F0_9EURO|nr:hypothetical protein PV11_05414 [Exophiala sideris]
MHMFNVITSALLLATHADLISAKAISHLPNALRRRDYFDKIGRDVDRILRREPQPQSSGTLSVAQPSNMTNATIASACVDALGPLTSVTNPAGLAACYNIIQYDATQGAFTADLRLYSMFPATGSFEGLAVNDLQIGLMYPASTMFQSITKRRKRNIEERDASNAFEIQQYSLFGTFESNLDLTKLNDTQVMSLMLPTIMLNAVDSSGNPIAANVTETDGAWFVVGQFKDDFKSGLVSPTVATAAIATAAPFVLPGRTFGIFPIGFIVTGSWTVLFLIAYGIGTLGRIKYRSAYRKRKAAQAGRTGKKI